MQKMSSNRLARPEPFKCRTANPGDLLRLLAAIVRASPDLRAHGGDMSIDHAFLERVMLAVSQVNQCRYCLYGHTRAALSAGVPGTEIARLLEGELGASPPEESVALLYAQHYAESNGDPDPDAIARLHTEYGESGAARIQAAIYMITLGNLLGNTFDGLISRLRGRPSPQGSLFSELATLSLSVLSVIPLGVFMALRMLFSRATGTTS